ncbi:MAG: carnitine dehydratase [Polyangiaceae bacterium UTPRO1]|nr:CaiB/BaiF CoA-transferase family protein [Myxococcales bacterium]OQY66857.1 MAG: carnitine dehydratase [Polyangiaceae bacterium UTPRO1]
MPKAQGPLSGIRIVELVGIGPGPFACMLLADLGADVIRVDRAQNVGGGDPESPPADLLARGRRSIGVDLKTPAGVETVLRLVAEADVLIEGFRPGVMERLGLGPEVCAARNPRLVYGRMTGWGQEGPLANAAGHDINYISLTGALHAIGRRGEAPVPPLNLVGDFGGGTMYLVMGVLAALVERQTSGKGQVVDAAMTDGAASLMTIFYGIKAIGFWKDERGVNMLDSGAHFYDVYETKDGRHVSIGSIEPQFYALLLQHTGLAGEDLPAQFDRDRWPELKEKMAAIFRSKTRDEWCAIMEGSDVCFAPVLSMTEAPRHPHNVARGTFTEVKGVVQPAPAPRFSRTPGAIQGPPAHPGQHTDAALADWGFSAGEIAKLRAAKAIA